MKVAERPSLQALNTFGVDATAALRIDIESEEDVLALPGFDPSKDVALGGGSNVLLVSDVPGTLYLNKIMGREIIGKTDGRTLIEVGAGENWHDLVLWTLDQQLSGLENLSLIPGNVGAAPMQNIGAYGVEVAAFLDSVTAWDWQRKAWKVFDRDECLFGYRDSRFKSLESDRYLITSVRLALDPEFAPRLEYSGLVQEVGESNSDELTAREVSAAVIRIRQRKLPDPAKLGNAGSFFKNPVLADSEARLLQNTHPGLPAWPAGDGKIKLSAAWMIDDCGLKGCTEGAAEVSRLHALVLVNRGGASGEQIWRLARRVQDDVEQRFGIRLEPEPRIFDFTHED